MKARGPSVIDASYIPDGDPQTDAAHWGSLAARTSVLGRCGCGGRESIGDQGMGCEDGR